MNVIIRRSIANGEVKAPPSKSMAHRMLICAALADKTSRIENIAYSEDILATIDCIRAMGATVDKDKDAVTVKGIGGKKITEPVTFLCRESGSTLRFFVGIALAICPEAVFCGSERLMERPLSVYEKICSEQGIVFETGKSIHIRGNIRPGEYELAANISSQFISGLLFALPLLDKDSTIRFNTNIESGSYIALTIRALSEFGIDVRWMDEKTLLIEGNQKYISRDTVVEGDYSNAAFLDVFNTIGGCVFVSGLKKDSIQGDRVYKELFEKIVKEKPTIDLKDCPDLGPVLMAAAACNNGAEFIGTARLKIKESDRGRAMCDLLAKFGVDTVYEDDRIEVKKCALKTPKDPVEGCNDHRIVMTAATLLSITGGQISGAQAVRKSYPNYFDVIKKLGIEVETDGMD